MDWHSLQIDLTFVFFSFQLSYTAFSDNFEFCCSCFIIDGWMIICISVENAWHSLLTDVVFARAVSKYQYRHFFVVSVLAKCCRYFTDTFPNKLKTKLYLIMSQSLLWGHCFADALCLFEQPRSVTYHWNQYDEEI